MTNGGTGPFNGQLLLVNSGRGNLPPSVALANPQPPHNVEITSNRIGYSEFQTLQLLSLFPVGIASLHPELGNVTELAYKANLLSVLKSYFERNPLTLL